MSWDNDIPFYGVTKGFKYNEDVEFSVRLKQAGVKIHFDKNNTVWHNDESYFQSGEVVLRIPNGVHGIHGTSKEFLNLMKSIPFNHINMNLFDKKYNLRKAHEFIKVSILFLKLVYEKCDYRMYYQLFPRIFRTGLNH